jgi:triacylglycerol lipase
LRVHTFGGFAATPDYTLAIYPKAFSVIVPMEGPIKERHNDLVAGVARGDILLFRAFFRDDDWNRPIREIYNEAQKRKPKLMKTDSGPSTKNVVLVHGIHDTAQKMQRMAAWLTADGFQPFTPALSPADGSVGLDQLAVQLRTSIDAHLGPTTPFSLVGFSMGGIVSRYYVQRLGGADRVRHFITISAPNHGTAIAWLQNKPGVRQMRPGSDFLNALNADAAMLDRTHFTSIWTPLDLMIIPASSSKMPVGKNVSLFSIAHPLMVSQRNSLCLIAERLRE